LRPRPASFDQSRDAKRPEEQMQQPKTNSKNVAFWIVTTLFCLQLGFTAYAELRLPQVAQAFAHLGFPDYFRVELSWAKFAGIVLLLAPVPARAKEWAYAGFAIDLVSAIIAHLAVGDGPQAWGWAAATAVLWAASYVLWRRRRAAEPTVDASVIGIGASARATHVPSAQS